MLCFNKTHVIKVMAWVALVRECMAVSVMCESKTLMEYTQ